MKDKHLRNTLIGIALIFLLSVLFRRESYEIQEIVEPEVFTRDKWIVERVARVDKDDIVEYRKKIIYNRYGVKHYLVFTKLKDGRWILYEIIHPKEEGMDYVLKRHKTRRLIYA